MDDQVMPNVANIAINVETVPWLDRIRYRSPLDELIIRTGRSREPFTDARALELARTFSEEPIHQITIDMTHLSPTSEGTTTLAASLEAANIQEVELRGSSTDNDRQVLGVLLAALKGHPTLSCLLLSGCDDLGDDLATVVESRPFNLTEIKLNFCDFANADNPRGWRCIGRAMHDRCLTSFKFVQLYAQIELSSVRGGEIYLKNISCSAWIESLLADYSDIRHVTLSGQTSLVSVRQCSIEKLSLKGRYCNLAVVQNLDSNLRSRAGSLKELELCCLYMDLDCWEVVISGMAVCHSLASLSVDACMESVPGRGALIGRVLRCCQQIASLRFSEDLHDAHVNMFIEDLRTIRTLKSLSLARNKIVSVVALSDCWRHNPSLETLDLSNNDIVDLTPLFRMLVDRQAPTDLFLARNRCNNHGWDTLSDAVERGARLRKLRLDVNPNEDVDCLSCIRVIRGMESQPYLKEFHLSWQWTSAVTSDVVLPGAVVECLIGAIGSFRFLEELSFVWDERMLHWVDWNDACLAAVKKNESLLEILVDGVGDEDFKSRLNVYKLRNRVKRALESSARGLCGYMLRQLHKWPESSVGLSNMLFALKTHPKLSETAGCSRSTKHPLDTEELPSDGTMSSFARRAKTPSLTSTFVCCTR